MGNRKKAATLFSRATFTALLAVSMSIPAGCGRIKDGIKGEKNGESSRMVASAIRGNPAFVSGDSRLEASEIEITTKLAGKIDQILVNEGDNVKVGQTLVQMQTVLLKARLDEARAQIKLKDSELNQAKADVEFALAKLEAATADLAAQKSILFNAEKEYQRAKELHAIDVISEKEFEARETEIRTANAKLNVTEATVSKEKAALETAQAAVTKAEAAIVAAKADADSIQADIDDSTLTSPVEGRILRCNAKQGESLSAGDRVLILNDLTDVYLSIFVPEEVAGRIPIGADARILLENASDAPIPASVSSVSSMSKFMPTTVENRKKRDDLMFRVTVNIDPSFLKPYIEYVKTDLPGTVWIRIDDKEPWPDVLQLPREKGFPSPSPSPADSPAETMKNM